MKKIIAIALTLVMCLSVMSMVAFAAPQGLNSLAVVGENIPGVAAWDPADANGDMTEVSEGIFEKTLECTAATSMTLKIAGNDAWDDNWNFGSATLVLGQTADLTNGAGAGNMTLSVDKACKIKITVDVNGLANGAAATILVEEVTNGGSNNQGSNNQGSNNQGSNNQGSNNQGSNNQGSNNQGSNNQGSNNQGSNNQGSTSTGKYTLTVKAPASWTTVKVYTWTDEPKVEAFGTYPGSVMQKSGDVYKCPIDSNLKYLIISNQDGTKTDDLTVESGKNVTITIADDAKATITYGTGSSSSSSSSGNRKPAAAAPQGTPSNYRVVGNAAWMGSWNEANDLGIMVDIGGGVYRKNFDNVEPGSYELKITKDGKWDNAYGADNGQNFTFTVDQKCTITVDFTLKDGVGVISVYGTGVPGTADISMLSVVVLLALASVTAIVLVVNKKKFI